MSPVLEANRRSLRELSANPWVVVGSIVAGLAIGKLSPELAGSLGIIGEVYIELLKMVVLPFMVAAVIFSMRKLFTDKASAHILPRILLTFLAAFCAAALAGGTGSVCSQAVRIGRKRQSCCAGRSPGRSPADSILGHDKAHQ